MGDRLKPFGAIQLHRVVIPGEDKIATSKMLERLPHEGNTKMAQNYSPNITLKSLSVSKISQKKYNGYFLLLALSADGCGVSLTIPHKNLK